MTEEPWQKVHRERVAEFPADIREAHKHSIHNRAEILASDHCGCFYCLADFRPNEIKDWTDREDTALCPKCGIDAIIGSASSLPVTREFLAQMKSHWF